MQGYVLAGLVLGSIYAISALGLVLTYSSSRVINFAHGATAYTVAVFFHWLNQVQGWSIPASAVVSLLVFSPLLGLVLWGILFRHLTHAPPDVRFLATVGLWVALPAAVQLAFPFSQGQILQTQGFARLPVAIYHLGWLGVSINANQVAVLLGGARRGGRTQRAAAAPRRSGWQPGRPSTRRARPRSRGSTPRWSPRGRGWSARRWRDSLGSCWHRFSG